MLIEGDASSASADRDSDMPPGAFLHTHVSDVTALNYELLTDDLVASRYSRLLHMTPAAVRLTFSRFNLTPLKHDMILEVHYVHPGEKIGVKIRRVRKGTMVFSLPDGTPMLAQVCGNPLRTVANVKKRLGRALRPLKAKREIPDFDPMEPLDVTDPAEVDALALRAFSPGLLLLPDSGVAMPAGFNISSRSTPESGSLLLASALAGVMLSTVILRRRKPR